MTTLHEAIDALEACPELNLSNYDAVDIERLNDWALQAHDLIKSLRSALVQQGEQSRATRIGVYILKTAKSLGWKDDGEGAYEYIQRLSYAQGVEDAKAAQQGEQQPLTAQQRNDLWNALPVQDTNQDYYIMGILDAERHHGIAGAAPAPQAQQEPTKGVNTMTDNKYPPLPGYAIYMDKGYTRDQLQSYANEAVMLDRQVRDPDTFGQNSPHPDDIAVDAFAAAMKAKMAKQRAKGYGGWQDKTDCPTDRLQTLLVDHIAKGDPVDVGNFAMMLWNRGEPTAIPTSEPVAVPQEMALTCPRSRRSDCALYDPRSRPAKGFYARMAGEEDGPLPMGALSTPAPQPAIQERMPLTDQWIRKRCNQTWVFDTVKAWVREVEAAHGITKGGAG